MTTTTTRPKPSEVAAAECSDFNRLWDSNPQYQFGLLMQCGHDGAVTVTLSTNFEPHNAAQYQEIENYALRLLSAISRTKPGSVWGSTSDGVGGHVALESGRFVINKSGCRKLTCAAIARSLNITIKGY